MYHCIMIANNNAKRSGDCEHTLMSNRTQLDDFNIIACIVHVYIYTDQSTPLAMYVYVPIAACTLINPHH